MDDYHQMASDLQRTKTELLEQVALGRRLLAENEAVRNQLQAQTEFMTRQVDLANRRADILGATLTALRTNYATIREVFTRCETEALAAGVEAARDVPELPILSWPLAEGTGEQAKEPAAQTEDLPKPFPKDDDLSETLHEPPRIDRRSPAPYQT